MTNPAPQVSPEGVGGTPFTLTLPCTAYHWDGIIDHLPSFVTIEHHKGGLCRIWHRDIMDFSSYYKSIFPNDYIVKWRDSVGGCSAFSPSIFDRLFPQKDAP